MVHDDYLRCSAYQNQPVHPLEAGFVSFYNESQDRYYFALLDTNRLVLLRSEAYETEKSRENGVQAVIKNRPLPERYVIKKEEGFYYLILRAGNRKEIARSCELETEAEAKSLLEKLLDVDFDRMVFRGDAVAAGPADAITAAVEETNGGTSVETKISAPERTFTAEYNTVHIEFNDPETGNTYPALEHYYGHATLHDEHGRTGFAVFSGADGKHYFVVYNTDGSIYQRSAGFATAELRDGALAALRNHITHADRYRVVEAEGKFAVALVDEENRELSRSGLYDTFTEAFSKTPASHQMPGSGNVY